MDYARSQLLGPNLLSMVDILIALNLWIVGNTVTEADYKACTSIVDQYTDCRINVVQTLDLSWSVFGSLDTSTN